MSLPPRLSVANYGISTGHVGLFSGLRDKFYRQYPQYDTSRTWFINLANGIGDIVATAGLCKAFRDVHDCRRIVCLIGESRAELVRIYSHLMDAYIVIPTQLSFPRDECIDFEPNSLICPSKSYVYDGAWVNFAVANRVPILDWYKLGMRLPMSAKLESPDWGVLDDDAWSDEAARIRGRKTGVILFPYTNYGSRLPIGVWEKVSQELNRNGIDVYTNIGTKMNASLAERTNEIIAPISGTNGLALSVVETMRLLRSGFGGIFGSGGLAWLSALTGAKTVVIYNTDSIDASLLNSCYAPSIWTMDKSHEAIGRSMPGLKNLSEVLATDDGVARAVDFVTTTQ